LAGSLDALVMPGRSIRNLWDLPVGEKGPLGGRKIDGRQTQGFLVRDNQQIRRRAARG